MSTPTMNLYDPISEISVDFVASSNFALSIHENAALYQPLGFQGYTKSSDGTKGLGGILSMTITDDATNDDVETLMAVVTPLQLTLPNGDGWDIMWDPGTDRKMTVQFSLLNWQPVYEWVAYFVQAFD